MATESRTVNLDLTASEVGKELRAEPFRFDFFQAVRLLQKLMPERLPVGEFVHPANEAVHFGAHASLAFPASQIQALDCPADKPAKMAVNFMGLTGPEGMLPNAYTELIIERLRAGDTSLRDFFDIFNHRMISLFYAAFEKSRLDTRGADGRNPFFRQLLSLLGLGTEGLQDREGVPDEALIYYSGLLTQRPRSAQALKQILADYFDVPADVEQFAGGWYRLDEATQCCLFEGMGDSEELGLGAVVGDAVWDQQSRVRVILGPLSLERYSDFLPGGRCWEALRSWVRIYSNNEWDFEVKLILQREDVPACELGADDLSGPRLGWVSWMKSKPFGRDADDAVLVFERGDKQ
mgnify:CR=1 FL=1